MYNFHYNYIRQKYKDKARLLFTDTDSLTYEIEAQDICKDFWSDREKFDNSDYPEDSEFYDAANKKRIGCFKDEASGKIINEFVGLKSKKYSYLKANNENSKTAKGIKKIVTAKKTLSMKTTKRHYSVNSKYTIPYSKYTIPLKAFGATAVNLRVMN